MIKLVKNVLSCGLIHISDKVEVVLYSMFTPSINTLIGISCASFEGDQRKFALGSSEELINSYLNYMFLLIGIFSSLILLVTTTLNTDYLTSTHPIIL